MAPVAFERMKALTEALSREDIRSHQSDGVQAALYEARAIMALLAPEDGDLVEARKLAADRASTIIAETAMINAGRMDDCPNVQLALAAIRRGRQLERGGE